MIIDGKINEKTLLNKTFKKIIIKNIKNIPGDIFLNKEIEELILEEGIETIEDFAFYSNKISKIILPTTLKSIGCFAFSKNKINEIKINDKLETIGFKAFYENPIDKVELPNNISIIEVSAFPSNTTIIYDNKQFKSSYINNFSEYNFIEIYKKIMQMIPDFDFNKADIKILLTLIKDNNLSKLKSYWYNKNEFNKLYEELKNENINISYLFKISYILGFFSVSKEERIKLKDFIKKLYLENKKKALEKYIFLLAKMEYYPELSTLIQQYSKDDKFISFFSEYYDNYEEINKIIKIRKKEKIRLECIERKKLIEKGNNTIEVNYKIKKLRNSLKNITYEDLVEHFNNKFETKNEKIKNIIALLSGYMTEEDFKKVEELYKSANPNSVFSFIQGNNGDYKYEWLKSNDERLFTVGYITNCCFRISGVGEDILIQSIKNPYIKTMVIYYKNKMIGKTTAYYNSKEKYLLFNNIEISNMFMYNLNTTKKDKLNVLKTIILGISDQVKSMNENSYQVKNIRIGMEHNKLSEEIKNNYEIVVENLYENYPYNFYEGDANEKSGQAIIKLKKEVKNE